MNGTREPAPRETAVFHDDALAIATFELRRTEDESVRARLLPVDLGDWHVVGPFPAEDRTKAYETEFEPEEEIADGVDTKKTYKKPKLPKKPKDGEGGKDPKDYGFRFKAAGEWHDVQVRKIN